MLLHPQLGTAVYALQAAVRVAGCASGLLTACVQAHAAQLALRPLHLSAEQGLWVEPLERADARVREAAERARGQQTGQHPAVAVERPTAFRADSEAGGHALRIAARVAALAVTVLARNDAEGTADIDLQAQSHRSWTTWQRGLDGEEARQLSIWRGGAVATPTRRWCRGTGGEPERARCPHCGAPRCSARHLAVECPRYAELRDSLFTRLGMDAGWLARQPRVTTKSGWITLGAAASEAERASLQVAA